MAYVQRAHKVSSRTMPVRQKTAPCAKKDATRKVLDRSPAHSAPTSRTQTRAVPSPDRPACAMLVTAEFSQNQVTSVSRARKASTRRSVKRANVHPAHHIQKAVKAKLRNRVSVIKATMDTSNHLTTGALGRHAKVLMSTMVLQHILLVQGLCLVGLCKIPKRLRTGRARTATS